MRTLLAILLFVWTSAFAAPATLESIPNPRQLNSGYVTDPDNLIGADASAQINQLLASLEQEKGVQVAVVAVESIGSQDLFSFSQALFERWGIGDRKRDDGLLVLLVRDQNSIRLHTGYGLEGVLPDVVCKRIEERFMVPAFKEGRYGDGLLAGLNAVAAVLNHSSNADALAKAPPTNDSWFGFKLFASIGGGTVLLLVFIFKLAGDDFSVKAARKNGTPVSMRWTVKRWLLTFAAAPTLIVLAVDFARLNSPIPVAGTLLYGYFLAVAAVRAWLLKRATDGLTKRGKHREAYVLNSSRQSFWLGIALLFPVPFLPHYLLLRRRRTRLRESPRTCPTCKVPMHRLNEEEEDDHLPAPQQLEETLRSADHDIWQCTACGETLRITYPGQETKYEACPSCKAMAYSEESTRTVVEATRTRKGKGERVLACKSCGYRKIESFSMAKLSDHNSSSSSSSSGRSGGWGGGTSGGGGASSRW